VNKPNLKSYAPQARRDWGGEQIPGWILSNASRVPCGARHRDRIVSGLKGTYPDVPGAQQGVRGQLPLMNDDSALYGSTAMVGLCLGPN